MQGKYKQNYSREYNRKLKLMLVIKMLLLFVQCLQITFQFSLTTRNSEIVIESIKSLKINGNER